jgi:hypothetical protein
MTGATRRAGPREPALPNAAVTETTDRQSTTPIVIGELPSSASSLGGTAGSP